MRETANVRCGVLTAQAIVLSTVALLAGGGRPVAGQESAYPDPLPDGFASYEKLALGSQQQVAAVMEKSRPAKPRTEEAIGLLSVLDRKRHPLEPWRREAVLEFLAIHAPDQPETIRRLVENIDFHVPQRYAIKMGDLYSPHWPVRNYPAAVLLEQYVGARAGPAIFEHLARTPPEKISDRQLQLFAFVLLDFYDGLGREALEAIVRTATMKEGDGADENRRRLLEAVHKAQADGKEKGWQRLNIP